MRIRFTYALMLVLIAIFAAESIWPQSIDQLAFQNSSIFDRPWIIVTGILAHADVTHLVANLVALWVFGLAVEFEMGRKNAFAVFLLGALVCEFMAMMMYAPDVLLIGSSCGIFTLMGAAVVLRPFEIERSWLSGSVFAPLPLIFLAAIYVVYNVVDFISGASPNVAHAGHFTGFIIGIAIGFAFRNIALSRNRKSRR